jgi:hypothetical protein
MGRGARKNGAGGRAVPNCVELAPESGAYATQFANHVEFAAVSAANSTQFVPSPTTPAPSPSLPSRR